MCWTKHLRLPTLPRPPNSFVTNRQPLPTSPNSSGVRCPRKSPGRAGAKFPLLPGFSAPPRTNRLPFAVPKKPPNWYVRRNKSPAKKLRGTNLPSASKTPQPANPAESYGRMTTGSCRKLKRSHWEPPQNQRLCPGLDFPRHPNFLTQSFFPADTGTMSETPGRTATGSVCQHRKLKSPGPNPIPAVLI